MISRFFLAMILSSLAIGLSSSAQALAVSKSIGVCIDHQGGAYKRVGPDLEELKCANLMCPFAYTTIGPENYRGTVEETGIGLDLAELLTPIMMGTTPIGSGPNVYAFAEVVLVCTAPVVQDEFDRLGIARRLEEFLADHR